VPYFKLQASLEMQRTMGSGCICRFNGGYVSIWVVQNHPDDEGSSGWAMCDLDLRQQHPDGMTSPWYQKIDGTGSH
jgi:hypothetical protein